MLSLIKSAKLTRVKNAQSAGQTAINSSSVDMAGFDAVVFAVLWGSITSGGAQSIKLQGSSDDSSWSDLEGTSQTVADTDDNKVTLAEILQPTYRYVRCVVSRATQDSVVDGILAWQHTPRFSPVTQDTTVQGTPEVAVSPIAGTA